ncbi:signaling lymphocytic activation molecule-like isoform X2 [Silurus meridionalis]|uniref:signaling lymphocytic activation molecule-like isoform X2 n=1 Tax=Silurus meridionalis TaxID=175797 RepID=UPI001EEAE0DE|nr:signaling lymphocytic activation molecule-like isoform X2 [Silurus meridionalis]
MEYNNGVNISAGNRILRTFLSLMCCLLSAAGDEMVTLQEVEGTTITLHTGITGIQTDAHIVWFYGPEKAEEKILNSQMFKGETVTEISERFKERLQLDRSSGALTIRNISRNHSGVYLLHVITGRLSSRTFRVSVYAPVSTPVINVRKKRSGFSTESCSLLCSVENGEDVKLSWYRENERISITNNTDLSVPLNLPLLIQHHEKNTYICVSANPVSNKTTSLSITQLCVHNSGQSEGSHSLIPALISAGVIVLIIISVFLVIWLKKKKQQVPEKAEGLTYADITVTAHSTERVQEETNSRKAQDETEEEPVLYSEVRRSK